MDVLQIFTFEGINITILQQVLKQNFLYWKHHLNILWFRTEYPFNWIYLKIPGWKHIFSFLIIENFHANILIQHHLIKVLQEKKSLHVASYARGYVI